MADLRDDLERVLGSAYIIERELGGGGMSRVFIARETALARRVVVKVLPRDLLAGVNVERFNREILLAAGLQHPHIVPVHSAGEMAGVPYYTMPLVEGESLRARIARDGALPVGEAIGILRDVAKALAYAHDRKVVHRDIKPDNVLLSSGSAVVTDFGIAKALAASRVGEAGAAADASVALTAFGTTLGTPAYMAPEQAAADPSADHRVDLYAFGIMAYEMLTGELPFVSASPQRLLTMQMSERPTPITNVAPELPPALADLVMRCLEKNPADRPSSAASIVSTLETITTGSSEAVGSAVSSTTLRNALAIYAITFVGVAIIAKAAINVIGLPDWVFPGALVVMALGLPAILFMGYAQQLARRQRTPAGTVEVLALRAGSRFGWRGTTLGGVAAVGGFVLVVAVIMGLRAMGIGPLGSLLAAGRINPDKPILVADFNVTGADSGLRSVIAEAVRTDLGQSKAVSIVSPSAVAGALGRMKRPANTRLDLDVAREVALREGASAIVTGDLTPLGQGFVVTLRIVSADSAIELASFHQVAATPTDLIPVLGNLTHRLRERIGESLKNVRTSAKLADVTTSSLAALQKYAEGARLNDIDGDYAAAIAPLRQAVALDSEFAMAWRKLGSALINTGRGAAADTAARRAYQLKDRLPERERYSAAGFYFSFAEEDRVKAAAAYESLTTRFNEGHNNLARIYSSRREWARAESVFRAGMKSKSAIAQLWVNILDPLVAQGKFEDARRISAEGRARFPGSTIFDEWEWSTFYNEGRVDTALAITRRIASSNQPQKQFATRILESFALREGRLADAERLRPPVAPGSFAVAMRQAWVDIWYRQQPARALGYIEDALARQPLALMPPGNRPYVPLASYYALAGNPARARALLAERAAVVRDSATLRAQESGYHSALAEIAIAEDRGLEAVPHILAAERLPDGPASECEACLYVNLGRAHDRGGSADSAIVMFERYLRTPHWGKVRSDGQYLAGIHKRLGELYAEKGDTRKAGAHYAEFLALWKNADPELQPVVADVRRKLGRLGGSDR